MSCLRDKFPKLQDSRNVKQVIAWMNMVTLCAPVLKLSVNKTTQAAVLNFDSILEEWYYTSYDNMRITDWNELKDKITEKLRLDVLNGRIEKVEPPRFSSKANILSTFSGCITEDVEVWLESAERIRRIYGWSEQDILTEAMQSLSLSVQKSFNNNIKKRVVKWTEFKTLLTKEFFVPLNLYSN